MDTVSLIIGLGFLAIFTVPFLLVRMSNRKKEQAFVQRFKDLATSKGVTITEHETWNRRYAIGLDVQKNNLAYLRLNNDAEEILVVDLSKFNASKVVRTNKMTAANDEVIDRLELVISTANSNYNLEFFNADLVNGLSDELSLIEKWRLKMAK